MFPYTHPHTTIKETFRAKNIRAKICLPYFSGEFFGSASLSASLGASGASNASRRGIILALSLFLFHCLGIIFVLSLFLSHCLDCHAQVIQKVYRQVDPGTPQKLQKVRHKDHRNRCDRSGILGTPRNMEEGLPAAVVAPCFLYLSWTKRKAESLPPSHHRMLVKFVLRL